MVGLDIEASLADLIPKYSDFEIVDLAKKEEDQIVFFEWLRYASMKAAQFTFMHDNETYLKKIQHIKYAITSGLLNRIGRFAASIIIVSRDQENDLGEVAMIMKRCIFESCITLSWLCEFDNQESFTRYMADSIRDDIKLRDYIKRQIDLNNGESLAVEERMLNSIANTISATGYAEDALLAVKRQPHLRDMVNQIFNIEPPNIRDRRYIVEQTMGSHAIHGSWTNLLHSFLSETEEGLFVPREENIETHRNQFSTIAINILEACGAFVRWRFLAGNEAQSEIEELSQNAAEIRRQLLLVAQFREGWAK